MRGSEERPKDGLTDAQTVTVFGGSGPGAAGIVLPSDRLSHYKLEGLIGTGGMGAVYRASDERLQRIVAIKLLPPGQVKQNERRQRFYNEARSASALNHPSIVTIHDIGSEGGVDYIVMEYVDGQTLQAKMAAGPVQLRDALQYAVQIADALSAAHAANIVHRDLKPANIMITPRRLAKVLDFGLAKLAQDELDDPTNADITARGTVMGTVLYMSPEQARGERVDGRSDIFSFGALLYELVTGVQPFKAESGTGILTAILTREPPRVIELVPTLPVDLADLIESCLQKDRAHRVTSMDVVKEHLELALAQVQFTGTHSISTRALPVLPRKTKQRRLIFAGIAVACVIAGVAAWKLMRPVDKPPEEMTLTRLTADSGLTAFPDFSADGKTLVFASDRAGTGNLDIWVQHLGGDAVRLTTDESDDYDPSLSPDGASIAYRSDKEGGGVYIVNTLGGGTPRLLVAKGRSPRFSPDGSSIVYWTGPDSFSGIVGSSSVYTIPAFGGQPRKLRDERGAFLDAVWAPDSKSVLYLGKMPGVPHDWYLAPVNGGQAIKTGALGVFAKHKLLGPLLWSNNIRPLRFTPDGNYIVFAAENRDSTNLWSVPISLATGKVLEPPRRLTTGTAADYHIAFADSSRFVFSTLNVNVDIWSAPVDQRSGKLTADWSRTTEDITAEYCPTLSDDGSKMAFVMIRDNNRRLVVLRDLAKGKNTVLATSTYRLAQPQISADGKSVVYWEQDATDKKYVLRKVSAEGGAAETICSGCGPATTYRDGYLLYEPVEGMDHVMRVDEETHQISKTVPVDELTKHLFMARISPNRRLISFHAMLGPERRKAVFVTPMIDGMGRPEAEWIRVSGGDFEASDAGWSASGDRLYYLSESDGFRCVWMRKVNPLTGAVQGVEEAVAHFHHPKRSLRFLGNRNATVGLSIAGGRLYAAVAEATGNIWMSAPAATR